MAQEQPAERVRVAGCSPADQFRVGRPGAGGRRRLRQGTPGWGAARLVVFRSRPSRCAPGARVQPIPFTTTLKTSAWYLLGWPAIGGSLVNQMRTYRPLAELVTGNVTVPLTSSC